MKRATPRLPPQATALPEASRADLLEAIRYDTPTGTRDLVSLHPHPNPSRPLNPRHVVDLARSIAVLGLIQPLVIDIEDVVVAGSHRYAALRLLASPPEDRFALLTTLCPESYPGTLAPLTDPVLALPPPVPALDLHRLPVHIIPLTQRESPDEVWRIEVAENEQRRDYSAPEVRALAERLKSQGYHITRRRDADKEKRALPVLVALIGKSERQIQRLLNPPPEKKTPVDKTSVRSIIVADSERLTQAVKAYQDTHKKYLGDGDHRTIGRMLAMLERLSK